MRRKQTPDEPAKLAPGNSIVQRVASRFPVGEGWDAWYCFLALRGTMSVAFVCFFFGGVQMLIGIPQGYALAKEDVRLPIVRVARVVDSIKYGDGRVLSGIVLEGSRLPIQLPEPRESTKALLRPGQRVNVFYYRHWNFEPDNPWTNQGRESYRWEPEAKGAEIKDFLIRLVFGIGLIVSSFIPLSFFLAPKF